MTNESKEHFIADQVRALATIILTRRGDLTIVETKKDTGLDFHVYIDREDKPMRLVFGVLLRGVPSPVTLSHANKLLGRMRRGSFWVIFSIGVSGLGGIGDMQSSSCLP